MANYGFLNVLDEALGKNFSYDYDINWDKQNFAVEVSFLLDAENPNNVTITDSDGVQTNENIVYEDAVIFYNPVKSKFDSTDYLTAIPYPEKGLSKEFLNYFAVFLQETADNGLDDLLDFLESEKEEFSIRFDQAAFQAGQQALIETDFYKYPRY